MSEMTLQEYQELSQGLQFQEPLVECCDDPLVEVMHVEPLEGRNTLDVERTCVLKCSHCGKMYKSRWD